MKVLYVHDRPSGGAGESLYQLVKARQALGGHSELWFATTGFVRSRFEALALEPPPRYAYMRSWLARDKQSAGLSARKAVRIAGAVPVHALSLARLLAAARAAKIDVVHTNCVYLVDGALVARALGVPHVWQVRELVDLDYYQFAVDKHRLVGLLARGASAILCNSERTAAGLRAFGAPADKLRVIHNIVDTDFPRRELRTHLGLEPDTALVGIVGWITPNKRVEDFVELAGRLSDLPARVRFVIIGGWGGDEAYNARVRALLEASPSRGRIIHVPVLEGAGEYMGSLDVLVCPCTTESFGRTPAEALAAGTPAIGVEGTAVQEIIDHGHNGFLVAPGDVAAMERHVRALLADDLLARRFGEHGRAAMARRFGARELATKTDQLYRELVNGR